MSGINGAEDYCIRIQECLDSDLNDQLPAETDRLVVKHLETCAACAEALQARTLLKSRLKQAVMAQVVPAGLENKIRNGLRRGPAHTYPWILAAAAVLVVAAGSFGVLRLWNKPSAGGPPGGASYAGTLSSGDARILEIGFAEHVHCALDSTFDNKRFTEEDMARSLGP